MEYIIWSSGIFIVAYIIIRLVSIRKDKAEREASRIHNLEYDAYDEEYLRERFKTQRKKNALHSTYGKNRGVKL